MSLAGDLRWTGRIDNLRLRVTLCSFPHSGCPVDTFFPRCIIGEAPNSFLPPSVFHHVWEPTPRPKKRISSHECPAAARDTMQNALSSVSPFSKLQIDFSPLLSGLRTDSARVNLRCTKQCRRSSSIIYRLYGRNESARVLRKVREMTQC